VSPAYFTPNGKQIIATQGDDDVISVIDVATRKIVYTYGKSGVAGSGLNKVNGPDDAMMLLNGDIVASDIKNCRIIMIPKGAHAVSHQLARTGTCAHKPPQTLGSPSGAFPMNNGNYLVSGINGGWTTEMSLSGRIAWSVKLPSMVCDRGNHRLIIVNPQSKAVLWQYGQTGTAGKGPGQLNFPTGMAFSHPTHHWQITARPWARSRAEAQQSHHLPNDVGRGLTFDRSMVEIVSTGRPADACSAASLATMSAAVFSGNLLPGSCPGTLTNSTVPVRLSKAAQIASTMPAFATG